MPDEQAEYWSQIADKYDRVVDLQIGGRTRSLVRERVGREGRLGRAVEFGCGTGLYTEALVSKADTLVATDLAPGMLALARQRVRAANVTFQVEDCQHTSLPAATFDTAFISLVLHFTDPERTIAEMSRILRPGGMLLVANLDPQALRGFGKIQSLLRVVYYGIVGYRVKPPKGFGRNVLTEQRLRELLRRAGFRVDSVEVICDASRPASIPIEYGRAVKI